MAANAEYKALETALNKSIIQYLRLIGCVAIRVNSGMQVLKDKNDKARVMRGAEKGTSDIIACYRGRFVAIEGKVAPRVATPEQLAFIESVKEAGGLGVVAYSLEDVQDCLSIARYA